MNTSARAGMEEGANHHNHAESVHPKGLVLLAERIVPGAMIAESLELMGYSVLVASDGKVALKTALRTRPNLIFIDAALSKISSVEFCRAIRLNKSRNHVPIFVLSEENHPDTVQILYEKLADEVLFKPISIADLSRRIQDAQSRAHPPVQPILCCGNISIDPSSHRIRRDGKALHVSPVSFKLLTLLMENSGQLVTQEHMMKAVWGSTSAARLKMTVRHIGLLRRALQQFDDRFPIRTVRGKGYMLEVELPAPAVEAGAGDQKIEN